MPYLSRAIGKPKPLHHPQIEPVTITNTAQGKLTQLERNWERIFLSVEKKKVIF